jgi:hypothetical protein
MSLVGPSGCGKTYLIFEMLRNGVFNPPFDKIFYFYQHHQSCFNDAIFEFGNKLEFVEGVNFEFINSLPQDGTSYLLIFDDSCEEISKSREFQMLATAGRHRKISVIYVKHNLFHKSPLGRDIELQNTHMVLFKNPRDVQQIKVLSSQLGLGHELQQWYKCATHEPYGHLLIDISPKTVDHLRYSSGFNPTIFYLPTNQARTTVLDDAQTQLLYCTDHIENVQT